MYSVLYQNRYCDQEDFDLIVFSEKTKDYNNNEAIVNKINHPEFTKAEKLYSNSTFSEDDKILPCESSVLTISRKGSMYYDVNNFAYFTSKLIGNSFNGSLPKEMVVCIPDERYYYCACSFIRNLYIFGGEICKSKSFIICYTCLKYDTKNSQWSCIAEMKFPRKDAACSVFEGKIVVSGGFNNLKSVEAYDYYENKWNYLPNMIQGRSSHGSVSLGNKLFVIGGFNTSSCEVFGSSSKVFTKIKGLDHPFYIYPTLPLVSVGYKIIAFATRGSNRFLYKSKTKVIYIYDVLSNQWSFKENKLTSNKEVNCCTKVPVV